MPTEVTLPALGESVTEGTVSRWLKAVGDAVAADEPLVEVSTDKVDTEIPAPASGVLAEIRAGEDEVVRVGQVLGVIGPGLPATAPAEATAPVAAANARPAPAAPPAWLPTPAPAAAAWRPTGPSASVPPRPAAASAAEATVSRPSGSPTGAAWVPGRPATTTGPAPLPWQVPTARPAAPAPRPAPAAPSPLDRPGGAAWSPSATSRLETWRKPWETTPSQTTRPVSPPLPTWAQADELTVRLNAPTVPPAGPPSQPPAPAAPQPAPASVITEFMAPPRETTPWPVPPAPRPVPPAATPPAAIAPPQPAPAPVLAAPPAPPAPVPAAAPVALPSPPALAPVTLPSPPIAPPSAPAPAPAVEPVHRPPESPADDLYVTPLVRKVARDLGVDLANVRGSGVGGRIRKQDVLDYAAAHPAPPPAPAPAPPAAPELVWTDDPRRGTSTKLPAARLMWLGRMAESLRLAVPLTLTVEADASRLVAPGAGEVALLARLVALCARLLRAYGQLNVGLGAGDGTLTYHDEENIGFVVDTEYGPVTPVLHEAGSLSPAQIEAWLADVRARAPLGDFAPQELTGGTFTVASAPALFATAVVNQPQVAALGIGEPAARPVVRDGQVVPATTVGLSLTYDSRVVDQASAAGFLGALKTLVETGA